MRELLILIKNDFNILLGTLQGKKHRKSTMTASTLLALGVLFLVAFYTYSAKTMYDGLGKELGLYELLLFHGIITSISVIVIIGVMRIASKSKTNDADLLLSLPIKKHIIILSKTLHRYIFDWFFVTLLFAPYYVLYQIYVGFNAKMFVCCLVVNFTLPLLSIAISYILNFLVERLFNKFKLAELLKSLISVFIFILIMALLLVKTSFYGKVNYENLNEYFSDRPFSSTILKFVLNQNVFSGVLYLAITIIPFVIGVMLYQTNYGKNFSTYHSNSTTLKFNSPNARFFNLYKKELFSYVNTPAYVVNTLIGPILIIVFSVVLASFGKNGISNYLGIQISDNRLLTAIVAFIFCAFTSMTVISSCSISLESKNLWIIKTAPTSETALLNAKALLHFTILEPAIIIASIISSLCLKLGFLNFTILLIVPTILNVALAYGGLVINIWQPMLEFDDETKVVKQSISVLLTMVLGMLLTIAPVVLLFLVNSITINLAIIFATFLYSLTAITMVILLLTYGTKALRKL